MPSIEQSKGISTFIAVMLLMVLAVSAGAVIYSYTMGYLGGLGGGDGQSFGRMSLDSAVYAEEGLTAYVRNLGGGTILLDRVYVDSMPVEGAGYSFEVNGPGTGDDAIAEGETGRVTIRVPGGFEAGRNYAFKLVDTGNTQLTFTLRATTTVAGTGEEWLGGWDKRVKMTVDYNDVDDGLTDFPVLIYLSMSSGRNDDDVSFVFDELQSDANRRKIAVTTGNGISQCYVEIEEWDDANEQAFLWVKVPSISSSDDTELYLYYDRNQPDNTAYVGDVGSTPAERVWGSNFIFVSHMRDDPDNSHIKDSTSNNNDGTKKGANEPVEETGKIGEAQHFDNIDDYISVTLGSLNSPFTVEAWGYFDQANQGSGDYEYILMIGTGNDMISISRYASGTDGDKYYSYSEGTVRKGPVLIGQTWIHITVVWNNTSPYHSLYINGVAQTVDDTTAVINTNGNLNFGKYEPTGSHWLDGLVDEARVSTIARSAAWIKTSYEEGIDDLIDFGSEETE